jgi:hypothetical protein
VDADASYEVYDMERLLTSCREGGIRSRADRHANARIAFTDGRSSLVVTARNRAVGDLSLWVGR